MGNTSRLKPVLNVAEARVDSALQQYATEHGYRLGLKVRLRDVVDNDGAGMGAREREYIWKAHVDFLVFRADDLMPVLVVEYDGIHHADPQQIRRDELKNRICEQAGLPILRIDSTFARKEGRWTVLKYILWAHEMGKAFYEAQEQGIIPTDEPFYHGTVIDTSNPSGEITFTGLDIDALRYLQEFRPRHRASWSAQWWRALDGYVEVRDILCLGNGNYLTSSCRLRDFAIPGMAALLLAEEISTADLGHQARLYDGGQALALGASEGDRLAAEMRGAGWHLHSGWGLGVSEP